MNIKQLTTEQLLDSVWRYDTLRMVPVGGLPLEYYLKELVRRNPQIKLYHSELTAAERLAQIKKPLVTYGCNR